MNVIVDIGNTRTKIAFFEDNELRKLELIDGDIFDIEAFVTKYIDSSIIISSVKGLETAMVFDKRSLVFSHKTRLPIQNSYLSKSIGMDRLASAVGAFDFFPAQDCLIIDMGSAITIDFLSKEGIYEGGNISLGMALRFKALHNFTSELPLVNHQGGILLTSKNTEDAIRSGVIKSIIFEIEAYIDEYQKKYPNIKVILTGGDTKFFVKQLKKRIFANENLVLIGLNRILNYNVDKV